MRALAQRYRGRGVFMRLVLITQVIAPVAVVVGLFQEFVWVNGVGQYWSIILALLIICSLLIFRRRDVT